MEGHEMKLIIQLTEHVSLSKIHLVELDSKVLGETYPELKNVNRLTQYIQQNIFTIKDKDGNLMLDNIVKSKGLEEIDDIQYEVEVDTQD
jgi:hypothetical protein